MLLKDAIERFIFTKKAIGRSKDTIIYYSRNLNLFYQYFGNRNVKEIQDHTFMKYQKWLLETYSVKKISIQTYSRATKALLRWSAPREKPLSTLGGRGFPNGGRLPTADR